MKNQQKQGKSIDTYLTGLIEETIKSTLQRKSLQEKEKQDTTSTDSSKSWDEESKKLKTGNVSVEDIIEKLNSIRSGKSFKDDSIMSSFKKYFDDLDKTEKTAMFAFLKAISQIVTGEVSAAAAVDPSEKPADIEMKKVGGQSSVSIKPNVIKSSEEKKEKKPSSKEDTAGPVPITPKKK